MGDESDRGIEFANIYSQEETTGRTRTQSYVERFAPSFGSIARTGSVSSSVYSLVSIILGGGVLTLPYAFSQTGLLLGCLLLVIFALAADFSMFTLIACSRRGNVHHYEGYDESMFASISFLADLIRIDQSRSDIAMIPFGIRGRTLTIGILTIITYLEMLARSTLLLSLLVPPFEKYAPEAWGIKHQPKFVMRLLVGSTVELAVLPFAFVEKFKELKALSVTDMSPFA